MVGFAIVILCHVSFQGSSSQELPSLQLTVDFVAPKKSQWLVEMENSNGKLPRSPSASNPSELGGCFH